MKKYKDLGIYDFSDYAEEITGDDLFKVNGGATMSSEDQAAMAEALKNGDKSTADQIRSQYETQTAPSQRGGTGGSSGSSIPSSSGNGSGGNSGNTKKESGSGGSGGPSGGNNPGGPSGPSGPSAPDIPDEIKANPDAYNYYMSLQGKAKEEGEPDKYKGYNVLGAGKIPRQQEIKDNKLTEYDVTIGWKITVSEDPYYLSLPEATRKKVEELHPQIRNYAKFVLRDLNKQGIDVVVTSGYRSIEEQKKLFESEENIDGSITGANGGQSYHNYGLAFDIGIINDNEEKTMNWDYNSLEWAKVVEVGESYGFESGYIWKNNDYPHLQMTFGNTCEMLYKRYAKGEYTDGFVNLSNKTN